MKNKILNLFLMVILEFILMKKKKKFHTNSKSNSRQI